MSVMDIPLQSAIACIGKIETALSFFCLRRRRVSDFRSVGRADVHGWTVCGGRQEADNHQSDGLWLELPALLD